MLNLLRARAGRDIRGELLERMGRSDARRRLLIVPEQFSHESERAMCAVLGGGASMSCEVLSFTRLAGRLTDAAGGGAAPMLDPGGRMLLMYAALRRVADALTTYRAPSRKPAFLTGLLATVDECRSYRVEPEALMAAGEELGGRQGDKLKDLGLIYAAYRGLEAQGAADPRGRLDRLAVQLEGTRWGAGMAFYVYGFTDFTPQEERVLSALMAQGELTVALVCGGEDDPSGIFQPALRCAGRLARLAKAGAVPVREEILDRPLARCPSLAFLEENLFGEGPGQAWAGECAVVRVAAASPRQEVEWCAAEILRLLREENCRCRDIAVCARRLDGYGELVESVFARYGVPVFLSAMEDVLEKPVLALVTSALAAAGSDYPYEELFRYLKTGLTGITEEERDLLENYVLTWDLKGPAWTRQKPWDMHPEGYGREFTPADTALVAWLDGLRRRVIAPLEALRKGTDKTGRGRALALYQLLEDIDLPTRLGQRADSLDRRGERTAAAQYRQLWDILAGGLEQCALLLGDTELELEEFSRLFSLVLSQYDVGAIPVSLDAVTVGDAPRMAHKEVKALFLLGADSGAIPDCAVSPGLFTDQDRDALSAMEVELAPRQEDKLRREMTIAYETCCRPSQRLYVSYSAGEGDNQRTPCFLWARLGALFPDAPVRDGGDPLARLSAPDAALELAGSSPAVAEALKRVPGLSDRVERIQDAAGWRRGRLSRPAVDALFGPVVPMSATKLDLVNSCHFGYFLRFGLDAKPRQRAAFRAAEYGTFVHDVLERTLRAAREEGAPLDDVRAVERLSQAAAERYEREVLSNLEGEPARFRVLFQRMKGAALAVARSVCAELAVSDFTPAAFELGFGPGKDLPPVEVEQGVRLRLTGYVDRVDQWLHEGKRYVRVVDYKTGKKSFDFADVADGRGLQMLLYLFALRREGKGLLGPEETVPAGVLYVPARTPLVDGERDMSDGEIQRARDRLLRRQGLVLDDPDVLSAMERPAGEYRFLPVGTGRGGGDSLVTPAQMEALDGYITAALRAAAGELAAGNIDADPYWQGADKNPCRWCDYKAACHFEEGCGDRRRFRRGLRAAQFWEWMDRWEEDGGGH
ncbi:MAG: ATP-dependent nuclease subunit B [Oscillospiraceae bacterium]|jgi:ATP-dependent helicase/nuclease subunit B|nr:ATP-dependent nuclease subunit B [Oscillospiraceae bacterium]